MHKKRRFYTKIFKHDYLYDGHGAIIRYFSRASRRAMERQFGSNPVKKMSEFLNAYKVENQEGTVITTGHLTKRIKRK